jgi:hypothetical protein
MTRIDVVKNAREVIKHSWSCQQFDYLSFAVIDFSKRDFQTLSFIDGEEIEPRPIYFDLASLTKPLTLASFFHLEPKKLTNEFESLLNHRAGFKAWAVLGKNTWKKQILDYNLTDSETLYSDLSALRLMLEIEKKEGKTLQDLCESYWHKEMIFWQDMKLAFETPDNGFRHKRTIIGEVNDDNCYRLNQFCSHAGLFATVNGLCNSLLNLNLSTNFVGQMNRPHTHRFDHGWDTISGESSLAGIGAGRNTFGHLGFTGTSCWFDPEKQIGWVLLTNVIKNYWYERAELNALRRKLGELVWQM